MRTEVDKIRAILFYSDTHERSMGNMVRHLQYFPIVGEAYWVLLICINYLTEIEGMPRLRDVDRWASLRQLCGLLLFVARLYPRNPSYTQEMAVRIVRLALETK